MKIQLSGEEIRKAAFETYLETKETKGGRNAHYIPYLANVDSNLFGLTVMLCDGRTYSFGDTDYIFGLESISKVLTAILVMKESGAGEVLRKIGADTTGLPFNSIFALLLEKDRPSTPLVNAGAISACSMIKPKGNAVKKWKRISDNADALCGSKLNLIEELYRSESETNFNNRSIAWLLKNYHRIYDDPDMSLDLYTRQCSLGVTATQLATCAATIANNGINPQSKKIIFPMDLTSKIVSLIASVGFYQTTGDWMYRSGIPAKSGVGGGILAVYPGVMGVGAFAPPLDDAGNSVKGQTAVRNFAKRLGLNIFSAEQVEITE